MQAFLNEAQCVAYLAANPTADKVCYYTSNVDSAGKPTGAENTGSFPVINEVTR